MTERNRKWSIAAVVLLSHVLVLVWLDESMHENRPNADALHSSLFFLSVPKRDPEALPDLLAPLQDRPSIPKPNAVSPPMPPAAAGLSPRLAVPNIDWRSEAAEGARSAIAAQQRADALKFSGAENKPHKKCVKPKAPQWREEPSKYGVAGGLPFMRFHEDRCIFVLLFVGCGFGAKQPAENHLFDNMNNYPNDSSVPDLDECAQ
jgi:hypothetical protein